MYKNRSIKNLILSTIIMLLSLATFIFFFNIINNKNKHTQAVFNNLADKIAQKDNIESVNEEIAQVEKIKTTIDSYFVDLTKVDAFIDYLENIGLNTEVTVESLEPQPKDKNTLNVRVSFEGDFSDVTNTILLLENAPYNIQITKVSLDKKIESSTTVDDKGKEILKEKIFWVGNVTFNILAS